MIGRVIKWLRVRKGAVVLSTCSGILYTLGFCGFDQDYLAWFCLTPLLITLKDARIARPRDYFLVAWWAGFVAHMGVYTWLVGLLREFGGLPLALAVFVCALVCLGQSILFGFFGLGVFYAVRKFHRPLWLSAGMAMVIAEWGTPALFPSYLANSQYLHPRLLQGCALWGVLGLTFIIMVVNGAFAELYLYARHRRRQPFPYVATAAAISLVSGTITYGSVAILRTQEAVHKAPHALRVGLVQANMGIYQKTDYPYEGLRRHRDQSLSLEAQGADLIIWPESAYYYALDGQFLNVKREVLGPIKTPLLFGGLRVVENGQQKEMYNSAFLADGDGNLLGTYDKIVLLAFGEYLPLGDTFPILYTLSPQTSPFRRGRRMTPLTFGPLKLGTLICYEDLLPQFVRTMMRESPDLLINLTNDSWFGNTREPRIHLALSVFRAVEQRRYLVRSTNTGVSAIIAPTGIIEQETPTFERAHFVHRVVGLSDVTLYQTLGDWPGLLSLLGFLLWMVVYLREQRKRIGIISASHV